MNQLMTMSSVCDNLKSHTSVLQDSLNRDRIIIGTYDKYGRERPLRDRPVSDLDRGITEAGDSKKKVEPDTVNYTEKRSQNYRNVQRNRENKENVHEKKKKKKKKKKKTQNQWRENQKPVPRGNKCKWCSKSVDHIKKDCRSKDVKCHGCSKTGHDTQVCRSASVNNIRDNSLDSLLLKQQVDQVNH